MNYAYRYISPEDAAAYQRELLRVLDTRNESLSLKVGKKRADARFSLNTAAEQFGGVSLAHLREGIAQDYLMAGRQLLAHLRQEARG